MKKEDFKKLAAESKQDEQLYDMNDDELEEDGLPSSWSQLEDKHFPLFLSFPQLARLLEADFGIHHGLQLSKAQRQAISKKPVRGYATTSLIEAETSDRDQQQTNSSEEWQHFVSYEVFLQQWPHFDARLTGKLSPSLCWNEIQGVICGSEESANEEVSYLSSKLAHTEKQYRVISPEKST